MKKVLFFLLLISFFQSNTYAQHSFINKHLEKGSYDVGFTRVWALDKSRVWPRSPNLDSLKGYVNRPIRIDIWYPAVKSDGEKMRYKEYVYPEAPSKDYDDLVFLIKRWDVYSYNGLVDKDSVKLKKIMDTRTSSYFNAKPVNKRFPLIVYSAGWYNRSPDNTILAEYLASHGYVVATVPQLNPGIWTWNFRSNFRSVENQMRDLEFAIGELIDQPNVDRTQIAVIGYSTGGDVALLLQGRNELIDCVVGMDASWSIANDNDVINSPFFDATRNTVPILALRRMNETPYSQVVDSLKQAQRYIVDVKGADHGSFSDDPPERELVGMKDTSTSEVHAQIAQAILSFLNDTFKGAQPEAIQADIEKLGLNVTVKPKD